MRILPLLVCIAVYATLVGFQVFGWLEHLGLMINLLIGFVAGVITILIQARLD